MSLFNKYKSIQNTINFLIQERNTLVYKVQDLEENQKKILELLEKMNIDIKDIDNK